MGPITLFVGLVTLVNTFTGELRELELKLQLYD